MKKITICLLGLIIGSLSYGQDDSSGMAYRDVQWMVSWDIAFPTNNEFLDKTGFYGLRVDYRNRGSNNLAFGFSTGWNSYRQKVDKQLYESSDGSRIVFTDMIRRVFELPLTLNGYYYLGSSPTIKPYVGIGMGALYSKQEAHFNIYALTEKNWGFLVRPEIGAQFYLSRDFGVQVYGLYSYATNQNEAFSVNGLEHLSLGFGLFWSY